MGPPAGWVVLNGLSNSSILMTRTRMTISSERPIDQPAADMG